MTYIPQNKITKGYTYGGEYLLKSNKSPYIGYYHKLYNGKVFTGKNPNDYNVVELVESKSEILNTPQTSKVALFNNDPEISVRDEVWDQKIIKIYQILKNQESNESKPKLLPYMCYPFPTEEDYDLGEFTRYFVKKTNENIYLEINKEIYSKIEGQNNLWYWQLYIPFKFQWQLVGDIEKVFTTNKNTIELISFKNNFTNLDTFLKLDYLKFYNYPEINNIYTNGGEFINSNGDNYVGSYHSVKNKGFFEGKSPPSAKKLYPSILYS